MKITFRVIIPDIIKGIAFLNFLILFFPGIANAEGFRILNQSSSAIGQGLAFVAQADDPSAVYFNPAGMTQLKGVQFTAGILLIGAKISYTSPTGAKVNGNFDGTVVDPPPISFFVSANLKDVGFDSLEDWTLGFGVNSPFGLTTRYPDNGPFSTASTFAALTVVDFKPTVAYKINDWFSLGMGLDIYTIPSYIGEGQLVKRNRAGPPFAALGIPVGTPLEINARATALGFNLSFLFTPVRNSDGKPVLNLGFVYRSQTDLDLEGNFLANGIRVAGASAKLELPQVFSGGLAFWPVRNKSREWKLEVDLEYADWSNFENLNVSLSNGATLPIPENWSGSWVVMAGTEYKWLSPAILPDWEVAVRGGYVRSQSPVPEQTFDPAIPDNHFNSFSLGFGFLCQDQGSFLGLIGCSSQGEGGWAQKAIGMDFAYQLTDYETRTIRTNINPTVIGDWKTRIHVGSINVNVKF